MRRDTTRRDEREITPSFEMTQFRDFFAKNVSPALCRELLSTLCSDYVIFCCCNDHTAGYT